MELTMTRLLLLTIVGAILSVSKVSSNPAWATRANKRSELQEALNYLIKELQPNKDGFNSGNQRATQNMEKLLKGHGYMASDDELSFAIPESLDDSVLSEGGFYEALADIIGKELLDEILLDRQPTKEDKPLNTIEESYVGVLDESPVVSFVSAENQEETPLDDNLPANEFDQDLLNEVMMTYLADNGRGQERGNIPLTNEIQKEKGVDEPVLTEEERIVAETILSEIEQELEREKSKQAEKQKRTRTPPSPGASCPILGFLVDDCEIATIDGIDGDGYKQAFRQPCNWHQICYTCGAGYGISQDICDEAFYLEMLSRCGNSQTCVDRADFFFLAVMEDRVPIRNSPSVCKRKCLKDFLLGLDG